MIIPCEYSFYETSVVKRSPSLESVQNIEPDKVIELPLSDEITIEYFRINNIKVNNKYIAFCHDCFIPIQQLSEEEKAQVNIIVDELLKP